MTQQELFYPDSPGYKEKGGTSQQAAEDIAPKAKTIRQNLLALFQGGSDYTPEEAAEELCVDILAVRPRFTELKLQGEIHKTSATRPNLNGKNVRVWALGEGSK